MSQQAKQNNPRKDKNFRKDRTHTGDHSNDNKSSLDGPAGKPNPKLNKKRQGNLLDDKKEQAEFKAILDKISAEKKKIDEISDKIKSFKELRQGVKNNRGQGNNQKKTLLNQRKELLDQLTELKHQKNILQDALSSFKLPINKKKDQSLEDHVAANVAEFQNQINEIERSIQMDSLSLMEEKRKIGELEKVRKTKNQVDEYRKKATEISVYNEQIKAKNEELNKLKVELDEIFAAEKIQNEEKDKQRKSEEEKQAYYQSLIEQKRKHLDNVKQFKEESVAKKAEIDAKWDAWKKEQAVLREKRKEEYLEQKAERERQKKEYEELKQKKIQEEEAERKREEESKLPFCDEIASADELLNYLATIRYPKNKPNQVLKHSLDSYVSFEKFSINPPATAKDIEPVKAKIQQKKDDFLEKQKAEVVRREELKKQQAENEPKPEEQVDEKPAETPAEQAAETPSN